MVDLWNTLKPLQRFFWYLFLIFDVVFFVFSVFFVSFGYLNPEIVNHQTFFICLCLVAFRKAVAPLIHLCMCTSVAPSQVINVGGNFGASAGQLGNESFWHVMTLKHVALCSLTSLLCPFSWRQDPFWLAFWWFNLGYPDERAGWATFWLR